jgi:hypothetical protein
MPLWLRHIQRPPRRTQCDGIRRGPRRKRAQPYTPRQPAKREQEFVCSMELFCYSCKPASRRSRSLPRKKGHSEIQSAGPTDSRSALVLRPRSLSGIQARPEAGQSPPVEEYWQFKSYEPLAGNVSSGKTRVLLGSVSIKGSPPIRNPNARRERSIVQEGIPAI